MKLILHLTPTLLLKSNRIQVGQVLLNLGSSHFAINNSLPLESILLLNICDWSILMK